MANNKKLLKLMTELSSRKWISKLTGSFAQSPMSRPFIPRFIKTYQIAAHEAEKAPSEYMSLNDFFTRKLKAGMREIDQTNSSVVSPVDACITGAGEIVSGTILNVKGQNYTVDELLADSPRAACYMHGYYLVLYLSPSDYHRIHTPVAGKIVEREHLPGKVYPVNHFGLTHMKRVLSRNERLITYMKHDKGEVAIVKVGAMNVSSIQYVQPLQDNMQKGADLAYFAFGSTVVLLLEDHTFQPRADLEVGMIVRMGELLGQLREKAPKV